MTTGQDFEWQPQEAARKSGTLFAVVILGACVAAGTTLSWILPIDKLIVAIERNGVPPPHSEASHTAAAQGDAVMIADPAPAEKRPLEQAPKVVLINPGTVPLAAPEEMTQAGKAERSQAASIDGPANTTLPPFTRHRNTGDRAVLVIVRRRGAPYDTRVLRGRIANGRLIVDSRDRRGITIR